MAGLRQYNTLADVPFDYYTVGRTLQDEVDAGRAIQWSATTGGATTGTTRDLAGLAGITRTATTGLDQIVNVPVRTTFANDSGGAGTNNYTIHVFRNTVFNFSGVGTFDMPETADGIHFVFINCTEYLNGVTQTGQGGYWHTRFEDSTAGGFGNDGGLRPRAIGNSPSTNKTASRYGSDLIFSTDTQARVTTSNTHDCKLSIVGSGSTVLYTQPLTTVTNNSYSGSGTNSVHVTFIGSTEGSPIVTSSDFRGSRVDAADNSRNFVNGLTGIPGTAIVGFSTGFGGATGSGWIKSVDPTLTFPVGDTTSISYVGTSRAFQRYIELSTYNHLYQQDLTNFAEGITISLRSDLTFATIDNYSTTTVESDVTVNPERRYFTDSTGRIAGTTSATYIPDSGQTAGTISAGVGLRIPVFSLGTQASNPEGTISDVNQDYLTNITERSFWHDVGPTGEVTTSISKTLFDINVASGAFQPFTSTKIYQVDTTVSESARFVTGTTQRTLGDSTDANSLLSYFNGRFATPVTPQDISDAIKYAHSDFQPGALPRTINQGVCLSQNNILFNNTAIVPTAGPITNDNVPGNSTWTISVVGGLGPVVDGDVATSIQAPAISYGGIALPQGWVFNPGTHIRIDAVGGNDVLLDQVVLTPSTVAANASQLFLERGVTYILRDVDLSGIIPANDTIVFSPTSINGGTGNVTLRLEGTSVMSDAVIAALGLVGIVVIPAPAIRTLTFSQVGNYGIARLRGGVETPVGTDLASAISATTITTSVDVTVGTTENGETNFWQDGDEVVVYFLPTATVPFTNTDVYVPLRQVVPLTPGTTAISHAAVVTEILSGVAIDTNVTAPFIATSLSGTLTYELSIADTLDIASTKYLAFLMWAIPQSLLYIQQNGISPADFINIGNTAILMNAEYVTITRATGSNFQTIVGLGITPSITTVLNQPVSSTDATRFLITGSGGTPVFSAIPNPAGISLAEVVAGVNQSQVGIDANDIAQGVGFLVGNRLGNKGTIPYDSSVETYKDNL